MNFVTLDEYPYRCACGKPAVVDCGSSGYKCWKCYKELRERILDEKKDCSNQ